MSTFFQEPSSVALLLVILVGALLLSRWTRSHPTFDLSDLVTGDNGRVSGSKFCQFGAWVVTTWGFASMIQQKTMTEWYFAGYMVAWTGYAGYKAFLATKTPEPTTTEQ